MKPPPIRPGDVVDSYGDGPGFAFVLARHGHGTRHEVSDAYVPLADHVLDDLGWPSEGTPVAEVAQLGFPFTWERARDLLVGHFAVDTNLRAYRWFSVTQRELEDGTHDCYREVGCEPGGWCSNGRGKRWARVLDVEVPECEAFLDAQQRELVEPAEVVQ